MPNERHYNNELNLESVGINLPYNMQPNRVCWARCCSSRIL